MVERQKHELGFPIDIGILRDLPERKITKLQASMSATYIQDIFSEVPATYERINHVLTFGLDTLWRRRAVRVALEAAAGRWVDICTGTGETAISLSHLAPKGTQIHAVDFSLPMIAEAREKPEAAHIDFVPADISALPFPDQSLDLITMSFATRNINSRPEVLLQCYSELYRVLNLGGHFVSLETSQPPNTIVRRCFQLYVRLVVKRVGYWLSGSKRAYAYLASTIPYFYSAEALADILRQSGFGEVTFERLAFGTAAIHHARR
jgi:demethylmenaquinone methyltransferase/2-methoxy-6-polyprenyl-1,4-benzoquinol methylase